METLRFNALLERISKKDESAFDELYNEFFKKIKWVAFITLGNMTYAEDVLSEVCIKIWNKDHGYIKNPNAWIYQITKNAALTFHKQHVKKYKNNVPLESIAESEVYTKSSAETFCFVEFQTMLAGLDEVDREIVIKNVAYSYTFAEIAEEMKISAAAVHKRYQNAREKLKKVFLKNG